MIRPRKEFMEAAISEAKKSRRKGDYAIGAVIVKKGKIMAKAGTRIIIDNNPIHHAETLAISIASKKSGTRHLEGCILYTTHEPCPMCTAAAIWAKMEGIVFGAKIEDMAGYRKANGSSKYSWRTIDIHASEVIEKGDPKPFLVEGFMRKECRELFHG